ncbi:MAG: FAD-dependent oxidoreductase [Chloroflexi bacterium]|nr:FAD-dependent oxidoreductase [Chloroflexota bacterium]
MIFGSGFIGAEVAASLAMAGLDVTLLVSGETLLAAQIGAPAGKYLTKYFEPRGVKFIAKAQAASFVGKDRLGAVKLKDGREIAGDMAVVGVGVTPRTTAAGNAGLAVENGVLVDNHLRSSDPDIFAAGDVANFVDVRYGHRFRIEHWDNAKATGKTAGSNMAGKDEVFDHLHYFYSDLFDLNLEAWGDTYQTDEVIERPAANGGHPAWFYLYQGQLNAATFINIEKAERKPVQELLKARPKFTAEVRGQLKL